MTAIATSAELFSQLRRLIPDIPAMASELTLTLKTGEPAVLSVLFWPERLGADSWPAEQERKTFRLVDVDQGCPDQGLSTAHPQPGPSV